MQSRVPLGPGKFHVVVLVNLGLEILCSQSLLVLVLRPPGGVKDENVLKLPNLVLSRPAWYKPTYLYEVKTT